MIRSVRTFSQISYCLPPGAFPPIASGTFTQMLERLTPQQRKIAQFVHGGLANKEIAAEMHITEGTVKVYLNHIFHRLNISKRVELALMVDRREGLGTYVVY